jgi:zinc protease
VWETNSAVSGTLSDAVIYNRGLGYLQSYASMLKNLSLNDIRSAATEVVKPSHLTWVIVGDRSKIANGISELNIGNIQYLDAQGNPVR